VGAWTRRSSNSKLAVIATIRTMLNYFLAKDIMAFDKSQEPGPEREAV